MKEIELIYIPAQEKEKWVLLPAFRVKTVDLVDGEAVELPYINIFDAVSGYQYL